MPQGNQARTPQLLSPHSTTTEPTLHKYWARAPQLLSPCSTSTEPTLHNYWARAQEPGGCNYWAWVPRACAPQQEKPLQWEARTLQLESSSHNNEDPA